ncbi:hypothetical protein KY329_04995, partial [Candidatus Woesearchaeota archaeon]|nr:hypothetical protein [Candidatus Woesearchaeota archaeon]
SQMAQPNYPAQVAYAQMPAKNALYTMEYMPPSKPVPCQLQFKDGLWTYSILEIGGKTVVRIQNINTGEILTQEVTGDPPTAQFEHSDGTDLELLIITINPDDLEFTRVIAPIETGEPTKIWFCVTDYEGKVLMHGTSEKVTMDDGTTVTSITEYYPNGSSKITLTGTMSLPYPFTGKTESEIYLDANGRLRYQIIRLYKADGTYEEKIFTPGPEEQIRF